MTNPFYNPTGNPAANSEGLSSLMRTEFALIGAGFDAIPQILTTGLFTTTFAQLGSFTFTLPGAPGTLATLAGAESLTNKTIVSPALTGTPVAPTAAPGTNTTQLATTAFDTAAVLVETNRATTAEALLAPKASPTLTGIPAAPTAAPGTNTTQLATTAFSAAAVAVEASRATTAEALLAPLASPALTGVPTVPTAAPGTSTTQAASTAFVAAGISGAATAPNHVHNGGFSINQRTYVSGTALGAAAYAHDRWKAGAGGCTYTFTQVQPTTTITITAGTLVQVIESVDVEGGTMTLSWTGTTTAQVNGGGYAASPITVAGLPANTNITLEFGGSAGTLGKVQMVAGSVAPAYQWRAQAAELALCQRFYEAGTIYWFLNGLTGAFALYTGTFKVIKRAAPTATTVNLSGGETPFAVLTTIDSMQFQMNVTTGTVLHATWTASADL